MPKQSTKELDQFYTNPKISDRLVDIVLNKTSHIGKRKFLEPSAGTGNFITSLINFGIDRNDIEAYDIAPKAKGIRKANYLEIKKRMVKSRIVIGNPPFGKRAKLAISFVNKGLTEANYVCMILPKQFERFLTQKQIKKSARLIWSTEIEKEAFIVDNKGYNVNCVFQIWTNVEDEKNLRILKQKQQRHADFETYIHNNTENTLKYFDKISHDWDIAVHRQGYYDYNNIITNPKKLIKNRQYFFIKFNNDKAKKIVSNIDFEKLAKSNTQTPGFSTTDFVEEYLRLEKKWK